MSDEKEYPRRRDDITIAELSTKFVDFMDRYERDWKHTQEWRKWHYDELADLRKTLNEIAPNYRRGMIVVTTIVLGSIAFAVKAFLSHFVWK